jgi:hypothetical protein
MALLLPAVNMVREDSRQLKCLNNQEQIAKAIVAYDVAHNRLPAVLNHTAGGAVYSWAEAILPNLDHADMWQQISAGAAGSVSSMRVSELICPNDPYMANPSSSQTQALLSYGVNDGFFVSYVNTTGGTSSAALDRNNNKVVPADRSNLKARPTTLYPRGQSVSSLTTIMVGERSGVATSTSPAFYQNINGNYPYGPGKWTDQSWTTLTFPWPVGSGTPPALTQPMPVPISPGVIATSPGIMVSNHPGKVIVIFFDGHGDRIPNDTLYPQ